MSGVSFADDRQFVFRLNLQARRLAELRRRRRDLAHLAEADGVLTVLPQTPTTGAEIAGLALSQSLTDREVEAVRDALLIHKAIFFRAQNIDHDTHVAVAEQFGELIVGHISLGHVPDHR